jgi:O-antigen/teichoic acid export membrane protein
LLVLIFGILLGVFLLQNFSLFGDLDIEDNLKNSIVIVGFIVLILTLLNNLLNAIMEAKYLVHFSNIGFSISSLTLYGFIYLFTLFTKSITILIYAPLLSMVTVMIYNLSVIRKNTTIKLCIPNKIFIKKLFFSAIKFLNLGLINSIVVPANKYLLIYITGNATYLAIFDLSLKIAMIANSLLHTLATPLFGVFSNFKEDEYKKIFQIAKKISLVILAGYIVGNTIFYFYGLEIASFIDSENSQEIAKISMILLIGITSIAISEPFYRALMGTSRLKEAFYLKLIGPVVNLIIYFMFFSQSNELVRFSLAMSSSFFLSSNIIILYYIVVHRLRYN